MVLDTHKGSQVGEKGRELDTHKGSQVGEKGREVDTHKGSQVGEKGCMHRSQQYDSGGGELSTTQ